MIAAYKYVLHSLVGELTNKHHCLSVDDRLQIKVEIGKKLYTKTGGLDSRSDTNAFYRQKIMLKSFVLKMISGNLAKYFEMLDSAVDPQLKSSIASFSTAQTIIAEVPDFVAKEQTAKRKM